MRCYSCTRWYVILYLLSLLQFSLTALDFSEALLDKLKGELLEAGFVPYVTSVGGSGLGVLSPYVHENLLPPPVTPPETPTPDGSVDGSDEASENGESLRNAFRSKTREELAKWATQRGRWLYV